VLPVGVLRCRRAAQMVGDTPSTTPSTTHRLKITEGSFAANSAWLVFAAIAFNLTRAGGTIASVFHAKATTATIRRQLIAVLGRPHPKTHGAGPQSLTELRPIRADLERAQEDLQSLRFKLASALFLGMPPGTRQVLEP